MRKGPHPALFSILILPYGAAFGFIQFALPVIATRNGVSAPAIGRVIAASFLMHTFKVLLAPVVDTTLTRKTWYLIASVLTVIGIVVLAAMPITESGLPALYVVVMASQIGVMLMGFSCESFMALTIPDEEKGHAAGWYNAGNFAGVGIGGWAALRLTSALGPGWTVGAVIGAVMLVCAVPLIWVPNPVRDHAHRIGVAMRELGRDFVGIFVNRYMLTGLVIAASPVGAAAVQNLFNATAGKWHIDETFHWQLLGIPIVADDILGLVGGVIGGIVAAGGALVAGWLADKMPRRLAYALAGALLALCDVGMALSPLTPATFVIFQLVYAVFTGAAYAAFSAFVLETIGRGAVATKYNIFAGGANLAIWYSQTLDTVALEHWDTTAMLLTDAVQIAIGISVILMIYLVIRPTSPDNSRADRA